MSGRTAFLRWLPFAVALAWLGWEALRGTLRPDALHVLAAGLAGAAWLAGRRLGLTAAGVLLLLAPLAWHFAWRLPQAERALLAPYASLPTVAAAGPERAVRLEGTVRGRSALAPGRPGVRVLLGDALLWVGRAPPAELPLLELDADLPAASPWAIPYRARLLIAGRLEPGPAGAVLERGRLRLAFAAEEHAVRAPPLGPWSGEALRLHLRDRAAYYLSRPALAIYLPTVLGLVERDTPEAREVAAAFRRVGVAHLFAISGQNVTLLYLLFLAVQHWGLGWLLRGQGGVHAPAVRRAGVMALVWLYIALIGFPIPAVRAALMGSLLVWNEQGGTRSPPLYILGLAGLLVLAADPSQLYDISFQLSFLAYGFLLSALGLYRPLPLLRGAPGQGGWPRWLAAPLQGAWLNLWVTLLITLGLSPLVASAFGRISLLVFAGNLVMVPLLGLAVLPAGLAALTASLAYVGAAPGAWPERAVFAALDVVLRGYVWLVERLDALSGPFVLSVRPDWPPQAVVAYYALLLAAIAWAFRRRNARQAASGAAP